MAGQSAERRSVRVELGDRSYPVLVGRGAVDGLEALLGASRTVALVTQDGIPDLVDPASLGGRSVERLQIGRGEEYKSLDTVGELCSAFAAASSAARSSGWRPAWGTPVSKVRTSSPSAGRRCGHCDTGRGRRA